MRWLPLATLFVACFASNLPAEIKPRYSEATLIYQGQTIKASEVRDGGEAEHWVGNRRFIVKDDTVIQLDAKTAQPVWSLKSPDDIFPMWWTAADDKIAFLVPYRDETSKLTVEPALELRRLDLVKKQWLDPLALPREKPSNGERDQIVTAALGDPGLAVLTEHSKKDEFDGWKATSQRLTLFRDGKQVWSTTYPAADSLSGPGVYLFAARMPDYANANIQYLTWIGNKLLFCGAETADILCVDSKGKTLWKVRRIWEFERGFIGPSVWSHYIARFGDDNNVPTPADDDAKKDDPNDATLTPEEKEYVEAQRKHSAQLAEAFHKHFQGSIIGGPIVVPPEKGAKVPRNPLFDDGDVKDAEPSIFVAVAKGPAAWNAGYLSECIIYQLNPEGEIQAMTTIPRNVVGAFAVPTVKGLVWACQQGAMARLGLAENSGMGMGMDNDCLCPVEWYRQIRRPAQDAWLTADPADDCTAFTTRHAFRTIGGGYVPANDHHCYRFPVTAIDLTSGLDQTAIVSIPFDGDLPEPKMHYSSHDGKISVLGPYELGITHLQTAGSQLRVTLGSTGSATTIMFDLGADKESPRN